MKKYLLFIAILHGKFAFSQLNETFVDGNFTLSPTWTGSNTSNDFTIISQQLRSNSTAASSNFYFSTVSALSNNCQWEFWVNLQFNPSSANYVDVYLTSDQQNLQTANINGYFIRIGNTNDEICLYKRSGTLASITKLIDGTDGILNTSNSKIKIRVTRTAGNLFTLERDITGLGTSFVSEGSFQDASFTTSAYFGIFIQQSTAGFHQKHFFDDLQISSLNTDNTPPSILSVNVVDSTNLEIIFNEAVDSTTAKVVGNYTLDNSYGNPVSIKTTADEARYKLKLTRGLNSNAYLLTVANVKDKAGNTVSTDNTAAFSYIKPYIAVKGDLVINEIFADPTPQIDLPSVEFVEIYNTTSHVISLSGWKYSDPGTTATFTSDSIMAGEYIIICSKADTNEYKSYGKTIGLSPWPSLNNASDIIRLVSPENTIIDSVAYSDTWYPGSKKSGGWSLERIDHLSRCTGIYNWAASPDITGGTPGKQNGSYVANFDHLNFQADSIQLTGNDIKVYLNKPVDTSTINNAFSLTPASGNINPSFDATGKQATISFSNTFVPNTNYQFNISGLKDCAANVIAANSLSFSTPGLPAARLDTAHIYITEIFADPSPEVNLPLSEFVEIYNPGKDTINLDGWSFNDPTTKASINKRSILPKEYLILCPAADTVLYNSAGKTIGLSPWPSLNNPADQIALKSFTGRLADSVAFVDIWHTPDKKSGGWTLERIDFASRCQGSYNWLSSLNPNGGTPGKHNSVFEVNYDNLRFTADSLKRLNDTTITVYFNKAADITTGANAYVFEPALPVKSYIYSPDAKQVKLILASMPLASTSYKLSIKQLKDCAGNEIINSPSALQFTTPKAALARSDTARLYITEIFADPSPELKLPLAEFVEIFNPGKDTVDLDGWTIENSKTKSTLKKVSVFPGDYLILCNTADSTQYSTNGKTAGLNPWPALTNTTDKIIFKSFKGRLVDSVSYSDTWHSNSVKKQGGWSLEKVDYKSICKNAFNWTSSIDINGGTPGKANSVQQTDYDKLPFEVESMVQVSDSSILITFNKHADITIQANTFTLIPSAGALKSANFDSRALTAILSYNNKFSPNTTYTCNITQLRDCSGNNLQTPHLTFTTPKLPPARTDTAKLFITEIFADPSPEVGLPLGEFIEIFNPGKDTIDLNGWAISNSKTKSVIRSGKMLPHEYAIICSQSDSSSYSSFGKVIIPSTWPALTNTFDNITLKSFKGRLVDSISYKDAWHNSSVKKSGGWTLERIDFDSACQNTFNWASSIDPSGGTPGKKNAIYIPDYDKLPFKADSIKQLSDTTLMVFFNKSADTFTTSAAFNLNPSESGLIGISFNDKAEQATLRFNQRFLPNTTYQLTITQLKDCAGNFIKPNTTLSFKTLGTTPVRQDTAQVYITEIFADPSPEVGLPLAEFVEIFNPGKDTVSLDGWVLGDTTSKTILKKATILPSQYLILCSTADTAQYKIHGNTLGLSPWPSLNNTSDLVQLKSFKGRAVDSLAYRDSWYKDEVKKNGGWSLERIDFSPSCTISQNWMASKHPDGGTPGKKNSVYQIYATAEPLKIIEAKMLDSVSVSVSFNRPPDSLISVNPDNYMANNGLGKPAKVYLSASLTEATLKFANPITRGNNYRITGSAIKDCSGSLLSASNNSTEFYYPHQIKKGDILVNEILFNPRYGGADFLELYNNSEHAVDLKELSIALLESPDSIVQKKQVSSNNLLVRPGQYVVLTKDPGNIQKEYHAEGLFVKMLSMPAFNSDKGAVVLLSNGNRLDELHYNETMHFALIKDPKGVSLERTSFSRPTNESGNFRSAAASCGFATPGYKNSHASPDVTINYGEVTLPSKTFSPDNDGFEDSLEIDYHFADAGLVATATIYNDKGVLIRHLAKNITLTPEGAIVWDGLKDNGEKADVGIYIVCLDTFNLKGETKKFKKACVLATKL